MSKSGKSGEKSGMKQQQNTRDVRTSGGRFGPDPVVMASATGVRAPLPEDGGWFLESDFRAVLFHC